MDEGAVNGLAHRLNRRAPRRREDGTVIAVMRLERIVSGGAISAVLGALLLAPVAGMIWSKWYWGYFFEPPALAAELTQPRHLLRMSHMFEIGPHGPQGPKMNKPVERVTRDLDLFLSNGPYMGPSALHRIEYRFSELGLDPEDPSGVDGRLGAEVWAALRKAGLFVDERGPDAHRLRGDIGEFVADDGRRLVFAGVLGTAVANDHYPYYELVAVRTSDGLQPLETIFYYEDIAGFEGLRWWAVSFVMFPLLGIGALITSLTAVLVAHVYRRLGHEPEPD